MLIYISKIWSEPINLYHGVCCKYSITAMTTISSLSKISLFKKTMLGKLLSMCFILNGSFLEKRNHFLELPLRTWLVFIRMQVWSLASFSRLRIWFCHKLQHRSWMRCCHGRSAGSPTPGTSYVEGAAVKRKKTQKARNCFFLVITTSIHFLRDVGFVGYSFTYCVCLAKKTTFSKSKPNSYSGQKETNGLWA